MPGSAVVASPFVVEPAPAPLLHEPRPAPSAPQPGDAAGTNSETTDEKPPTRPLDVTVATDALPSDSAAAQVSALPAASHAMPRTDAPSAYATSSYATSAYARAEPPAQIADVVASLARNGEGAHRLTLRLDPIELGHIEVVIDRQHGMPAAVTLTVERPETLLRLVRDQDQLSRALDLAGLAAEDRNIRFQLATRDAPRASDADAPRPDPRHAQNPSPNPSQDNDAAASSLPQRQETSPDARSQSQGGQHQPGSNRSPSPPPSPGQAAVGPDIAAPLAEPSRHILRLRGIDITA